MSSYNKVLLMGNLTRDPAVRFLPNQTAIADFGIACNRSYKTQAGEEREEVTFVDCTAFGRTAEVINEYFKKGKPIFVEGRLKWESWEDKEGGGKRQKLSVQVEHFQFIGGPRDGGSENSDGNSGGGNRAPNRNSGNRNSGGGGGSGYGNRPARAPVSEPDMEEQQFRDDDIPF